MKKEREVIDMWTSRDLRNWLFIFIVSLIFCDFAQAGRIIYVDDDANGTDDGTSWQNAFVNLQDALAEAFSSTAAYPAQIRVADGIYKPDSGEYQTQGKRKSSFWLRNYVSIVGGYAGLSALDPNTDPDSRDIRLYRTILSGDLSGNDVDYDGSNPDKYYLSLADNSYHVVTGSDVNETASLEGVTITAGYANWSGEDNDTWYGAGLYNNSAGPTLVDCNFIGNVSAESGALYNERSSSPLLENCLFVRNKSFSEGGAIGSKDSSSPVLLDCVFMENTSLVGGAMSNASGSSSVLKNCSFIRNRASIYGGAVYNSSSNSEIDGCIFSENLADDEDFMKGGAIYNYDSNAVVSNCIFSGNAVNGFSDAKGGAMYNSGGSVIITNSTFNGNMALLGGGLYNYNCIPVVKNCIFRNNSDSQFAGSVVPVVSYSNIEGGFTGQGNIKSDPYFAKDGYWSDPEDPNVIITDPAVRDRVWNEGDYHLQSQAGRWDPNSKHWVVDDITSLCIDAGDPNSDWTEELWPHGKRINMGAYGGTSQASMSLSTVGDMKDLNNDDAITWDDVLLLTDKWDSNEAPLKGDLDLNGVIDANDLAFFEGNWTQDSNNIIPVIESTNEQTVTAGQLLRFAVNALDNDGDELVYQVCDLPEGAVYNEQIFTWTPEITGTYKVTFVFSDHKSLHFATVKITVE